MAPSYLVRHGAMGLAGRFSGPGGLARGETVVIQGPRGTELGEILSPSDSPAPPASLILRPATAEDLSLARLASSTREPSLSACLGLFEQGRWPLSVVDVEPLLDPRRVVVYYFGPHALDTTGLRPAALDLLGLDLHFEPVGPDLSWDAPLPPSPPSCSSCGRADGGGGCGSSCSSCSLSTASRRR